MKEITKWCVENRMSANATKTKSMLITTWQKRLSLPENQRNLSIVIDNDTLENVTSDKLLGVTIDLNLSWGRNFLQPLCQPSTEKWLPLEGSSGTCPYLLESYFSIHTFCLTFTTVQLSGAVHPINQNLLLAQKRTAPCDIRHKGHIPA